MNNPDFWNQILQRMPLGSVVGGGCVRDYILGVPHKDIDVFVPFIPENVYERAQEQWDQANPNIPYWNVPQAERPHEVRYDTVGWRFEATLFENYQDVGGRIDSVYQYRWQDETIQLITLTEGTSVQDHFDSFDLGICQAAWCGGLQLSPAFVADWKDQKITRINPNDLTNERIQRFLEKFGEDWAEREVINVAVA